MTNIEVNKRKYVIHVGYWIQPYFTYITKLQFGKTLEEVNANSLEMEKVVETVITKALSNESYNPEDKTEIFNEISYAFQKSASSVKKKLGTGI